MNGVASCLLLALVVQGGDPVAVARRWRQRHEGEILREFVELLAIPNVSRDLPNIRRNAAWIVRAFEQRGVAMRLLEIKMASPAVFGELRRPGATTTVVFYAHFDGQPVDRRQWTDDPFRPTLRDKALAAGGEVVPFPPSGRIDPEWRLYARSAADDKAPIVAMLAALDALKAAGLEPGFHLKFFFEGEEEIGSINLRRMLHRFRQELAADLWIFCDGPVHQSRRQQVVFGVRGVTGLDLTVYGARRELHSGHYGNWAPNPAMRLARLLASMKDRDGRVLVAGFYDDVVPLGPAEREAVADAPNIDAELKRELWLGATEGGAARLEECILLPSLNVRGLRSANVGDLARNVVPKTARASIDIRLVEGMRYRKALECVIAHVRKQGFHVTEREPDERVLRRHERVVRIRRRGGYDALRTPMDLEIAAAVVAAVERARGPVIRLPTLGGSLPLAVFREVLGAPVIIVPIANHDNNQHAANENLRMQNLWDGIETMASLFAMR